MIIWNKEVPDKIILGIILLIGFVFRLALLPYNTFFEPDVYFHYSVLQQAINHNFTIPTNSVLSGFPNHNQITEPSGLYWIPLLIYGILQKMIPLIYIMPWLPLIFGLLEIIAVYWFSKELINDSRFALLASFFLAISNANIARTDAFMFRGDSFVSLFVIISLLILIKVYKERLWFFKYVYGLTSVSILAIGITVWNGAVFAFIIYALALFLLLIYCYMKRDRTKFLETALLVFILSNFLWLIQTFQNYNIIRDNSLLPFVDMGLIWEFMMALSIACGLQMLLIDKVNNATIKEKSIFLTISIFAYIIIILAVGHPEPLGGGFSLFNVIPASSNGLSSTINELQIPSFSFLFSSFEFLLFLAPASFIVFYNNKEEKNIIAFIVLFAYFLITVYLSFTTERYNSIASIPFAILGAYTFIKIYDWSKVRVERIGKGILSLSPKDIRGILGLAFLMSIVFSLMNFLFTQPAGYINKDFISSMAWISNNTPNNATFLTLWQDGSLIEGLGNRISYTDSVSGLNATRTYEFSNFLYGINYNYLNSVRPQYLLLRYLYINQSQNLGLEGNLIVTNTILNKSILYDLLTYCNLKCKVSNDSLELAFSNNGVKIFKVSYNENKSQTS